MDCPELYINKNSLQRNDAKDVLDRWIGKMIWKSNEIVLDLGCGPGDVTSDILYPFIKNKIELLIGVDKSKQMVEFAKRNYGCSKINFKVLDIENVSDCTFNSCGFSKIFSFYCLHWIHNKLDALVNMHLMLKNSGEILVYFLLVNPVVELYKCMDEEWKKYVPDVIQKAKTFYSEEEVKLLFIKAGFKIISIESSIKTHTHPDFTSLLNAIKPVDDMYNILSPHLHDRYSIHVKDKIYEKKLVDICPTTGKATHSYIPIAVHAVKD